MCQHQPYCPAADASDHDAARVIAEHSEQGWVLLCNGIVRFDDDGELLPDGRAIPAPPSRHGRRDFRWLVSRSPSRRRRRPAWRKNSTCVRRADGGCRTDMPIHLAERATPPMAPRDVHAISVSLSNASRRLTDAGRRIRSVSASYDADRRRWVGVFDADTADTVHEAIRLAQLPRASVRITTSPSGCRGTSPRT